MAKAERAANATTVPRVQPKLVVGAANDPLEREADDVADRIMGTRGPAVSPLRRCPAGCPTDEALARGAIAREGDELHRTPSAPLPPPVRAFFEGRMGADFAGVRVHAGAAAADLAARLNARAFTVGQDV